MQQEAIKNPSIESMSIGVVGLGDIGGGAARSIAAAGHQLVVCDLRADVLEGFAEIATLATSPAELARQCSITLISVVNDAQVREVVTGANGLLSGAAPGSIIIVASTISPVTVIDLAAKAEKSGVSLIDCGVSGGPSAAATGDLICMVGGAEEVIERARPALDSFSSLVVHMGDLGSGLIAKLARNVVQYGAWLAAYEGQRIAEAAGIELSKLAAVIRASDAKIGGVSTLMFRATVAPMGSDDHEGLVSAMRAAAALAQKDLATAIQTAGQLGLELPGALVTQKNCDSIFGVGEAL